MEKQQPKNREPRSIWSNLLVLALTTTYSAVVLTSAPIFLGVLVFAWLLVPAAFLFFVMSLLCRGKEQVIMGLIGIFLGIAFAVAKFYIYARFAQGGWFE